MMTTALIYDQRFLAHDTGLYHPENPKRLEVIIKSLKENNKLWSELLHITPTVATEEDILRCHREEMLIKIQKYCLLSVPLDADTVVGPASFDVAMLAAGAGITAVDQLFQNKITNAFLAVRPPGHHATSKKAMGFCLLNNAAITARYAQAKYGIEKILIVDWDVHHGNGTQEIFYSDPSVFYFSVHEYPFYPGTGSAEETGSGKGLNTTLNIPIAPGTSASEHHKAFSMGLKQVLQRFHPELIIISAGFDAAYLDPLADLSLTDKDYAAMTLEVMEIAEKYSHGKMIALLEGGYNLSTLGNLVQKHVATLHYGLAK